MENEEKIVGQEELSNNKCCKKTTVKVLLVLLLSLVVFCLIYLYVVSLPVSVDNLYCSYKGKFNKIVCVQTGDIVPEWLDIDENVLSNIFGPNYKYSMKLIFSQSETDYIALDMGNKIFVQGLSRKIIYEKPEQTFIDWYHFKKFIGKSKISNWGAIVLYCSDKNLSEDICKNLKKQYKK